MVVLVLIWWQKLAQQFREASPLNDHALGYIVVLANREPLLLDLSCFTTKNCKHSYNPSCLQPFCSVSVELLVWLAVVCRQPHGGNWLWDCTHCLNLLQYVTFFCRNLGMVIPANWNSHSFLGFPIFPFALDRP